MNLNQTTKRKTLVTKFRSPQSVGRLVSLGILKPLDKDDDLAPTSVGVECSEDPDSITKSSLIAVLQALQNLYDVTSARKQIYRHDVLKEVSKLQGETVPEITDRVPLFRPRAFGSRFLWFRTRSPSDNAVRPRMDGHIRKYRNCGCE